MTTDRRRRGQGTIDRTRDGRFVPRLPALTPGGERQRLDPCATREDAVALLNAALAVAADAPTGGLTLRSWGERWLDKRELSGVRGIGTDRSRWRVHVETAAFIDWPIASIERFNIRDWLDGMLSKRAARGHGHRAAPSRRLGRVTIQNTLNLLRTAFAAALDAELIAANPAQDVHLPRRRTGETHEPWTYLLPAEQAALLAALDVAARCLVAFAMGTGLRQGELWNARLVDVAKRDDGRWLTVRFGSKGRATKSGKVRHVPIFGVAEEALDTWLPLLAAQPNPHGLLFPTARGERRQKGKAPRAWDAWLVTASLTPEKRHDGRAVRWHDLRHTCASSLVAGWWGRRWSLEEVRALLGHSSILVTQRYAHLAESALESAARATDLSAIRPQEAPSIMRKPLVPPAGIGPATFGLGKRSFSEEPSAVDSLRRLIADASRDAREALGAIAAGGPSAWRVVTEALARIARAEDAATELVPGKAVSA